MAAGTVTPPAVLAQALATALDDEYRARATYRAVLDSHGPVLPFVNIAAAEQRHIDALLALFAHYGLVPPPDRWAGSVAPPPSLAAACAAGVAGEIGNYGMYDQLLTQVGEPDVRAVFTNLRNASAYHHLPAFQRCAGQSVAVPAPAPTPSGIGAPAATATPTAPAQAATGTLLLGLAVGAALVWLLRRGRA